jgi:hypothetical protein
MATFDSGRQRYSMNFYASHQRPLQRRSYTGRPSRPAEGQLRVKSAVLRHRPITSGLPPTPDIVSARRHVSKVPATKVTEPYSITSLASASRLGDTVTPSCFAVLRFMTSS